MLPYPNPSIRTFSRTDNAEDRFLQTRVKEHLLKDEVLLLEEY